MKPRWYSNNMETLIIIFYLKQGVGSQRKLGKTNDSSKHCLVLKNIVTVGGIQYPPIFELFINGLLSAPHPLCHVLHSWIRICQQTTWTFNFHRCTPTVTPICFTPLSNLQVFRQSILENHLVVPITRLVRPIPPANIPRLDAQPYLVTVPAPLEFEAIKSHWPAHREAEVCAVHREETVISDVPHLPVFECNLELLRWKTRKVSSGSFNNDTQQSTYQNLIQFKNGIDVRPHVLVDRLRGVTPPHYSW